MVELPLSINYRLVATPVQRPNLGTIEIYGARSTIKLKDPTGTLHKFLCGFSGFSSLESLLKLAAGESYAYRDYLCHVVEVLVGAGAITPASDLWRLGHSAGSNPQTFGKSLPSSEILSMSKARAFRRSRPPDDATSYLESLGRSRRSTRQFDSDRPVDRDTLHSILSIAYSADTRATPSAGGLNPCSISVLRRDSNSWSLSRWNPHNSELQPGNLPRRLAVGSPALRHALESEDEVHGAGAIAIISADPGVQTRKYGNRGYRYSLLDAGHISQMLLLAAIERGLATLEWGAFRDAALSDVAGLASNELPLTCIALGWPSEEPSSPATLERLVAWQEQQAGAFDFSGSKEPRLNNHPVGLVLTQINLRDKAVASDGGKDLEGSRAPSRATGAGWTSRTSRIRALGEAIERTASGLIGYEAECSSHRLPFGESFDVLNYRPADLPKFLAGASGGASLYAPYSPDAIYRWRRGYRVDGTDVWLPIELVYYPVSGRDAVGPLCGAANSSGVAAAGSIEAAMEAAFFELVERDAYANAWTSGVPPVRLPNWPDRLVHIIEQLRNSGAEVDMLAFSTHMPTIGVAIRQPTEPALCYGMATREEWGDAVEKALQEALSQRLSYQKDSTVASGGSHFGPLAHFQRYSKIENRKEVDWFFEGPTPDEPPPLTGQRAHHWKRTVFVDLSQPDHPLFCVRALSTDLIPLWFGPDWVPTSCAQQVPHFFS